MSEKRPSIGILQREEREEDGCDAVDNNASPLERSEHLIVTGLSDTPRQPSPRRRTERAPSEHSRCRDSLDKPDRSRLGTATSR